MALWLVRVGRHGEHDQQFIENSRIYATWYQIDESPLAGHVDTAAIMAVLQQREPDQGINTLANWARQLRAFIVDMQVGDWVVVPRSTIGAIAIGEITSGHVYDPEGKPCYRHLRDVRWINTEIPRSAFDQDLLYSFGAFMTVCRIARNDAEQRVRALAANGWASGSIVRQVVEPGGPVEDPDGSNSISSEVDLELLARDAIAQHIVRKFMGHGMARLVDAVLRAMGFTTHLSPEGPDRGLDILAGSGPFGFDEPKICVQVKSGDTPAGGPEINQLLGIMGRVNATQGLFVSWSGFTSAVRRDAALQFFNVRLWSQTELVAQLMTVYDKLDQEVRAEIPLKRVWMLASPED